MPGQLPLITKRQNNIINEAQGKRQSKQIIVYKNNEENSIRHSPTETYTPIPSSVRCRMVTKQAINVLTIQEQVATERIFTPNALMQFTTT